VELEALQDRIPAFDTALALQGGARVLRFKNL
jgi:hypothetical protein